jgi:hypothetical protein
LLPFGSCQFSGFHSLFQGIVFRSSLHAESFSGFLKNFTHLRAIRLIQAAMKSAAEGQDLMLRDPLFQNKKPDPRR